jgi:hypothetical protein
MQSTTPSKRVILDAAIERSVIRGTLTPPTGERLEFHGWLELNTALEAILGLRESTRSHRTDQPRIRKGHA